MVEKIGTPDIDTLDGTEGEDRLFGEGNNDILEGFGGADLLDGGFGFDRAVYKDSDDCVIIDLMNGKGNGGQAEGDVLISIENVTGSRFDDVIFGDDGVNSIDGGGTAINGDILFGNGGDDSLRGIGTLDGGSGDDALFALGSSDLFGGSGDDRIVSSVGADLIDGGANIDTVSYQSSEAAVFVNLSSTAPNAGGRAQGDRLFNVENVAGSSHSDIILGNGLRNVLEGFGGDDALSGESGDDELLGGFGDDELVGGDGSDMLTGGFGADILDGGAGVDAAAYFDSDAGVFVDLAQNLARFGEAEGDRFASIENVNGSGFGDTLVGDGGGNRLFGSLGGDSLSGAGGADTLLGGSGDDLLRGEDGDDLLDGGSGADYMIGGAGNDDHVVSQVGDVVDEAAGGSGIDRVISVISFSLKGSGVKGAVENLTLNGTLDINADGNALDNDLRGNSGDNRLIGQAGADTMRGGGGDDTYFVDQVGDIVSEAGASGVDEVRSTVSFDLSGPQALGAVENLSLLGPNNLNGHGNALDNVMIGNNGINVLTGAGGDDTLTGNGGANFFVFASALNAATNVDTITDFNVSQDTIRLENLFFTGLANGALAKSAFHIGASAADASDRIIYNDDTGALSFDADGSGAKAAIRFATLDDELAMTNADFFVI